MSDIINKNECSKLISIPKALLKPLVLFPENNENRERNLKYNKHVKTENEETSREIRNRENPESNLFNFPYSLKKTRFSIFEYWKVRKLGFLGFPICFLNPVRR